MASDALSGLLELPAFWDGSTPVSNDEAGLERLISESPVIGLVGRISRLFYPLHADVPFCMRTFAKVRMRTRL